MGKIREVREFREVRDFDLTIGRLDRLLSELITWSDFEDLDPADAQTLKHHADDLRGVADKILNTLEDRGLIL